MDAIEILTALGTSAGRADPYPLYAALHEIGDVLDIGPGGVMVVGYDAINLVLRDPGFRVSDESSFDKDFPSWRQNPAFVQGADWILNLNPPRHSRIRSLMARAFTARRIAGLEPAIARMADDLLDAMADRGADGGVVEFMHDFAYLLPITVICELMGIPEEDREGFRPVARDLAGIFELNDIETLASINAAAVELLAYFTGLAARRRASPRDDLLSDLLAVSDAEDGRLTDAELLHNLTLLLVAGFETTTNLIGNGLHEALGRPALLEGLGKGEVPVAAFVEETLRYDSPVQVVGRFALTDTAGVAGRSFAKNEQILLFVAAAHRDPRRFAEPDTFDPGRPENLPLSFGGGIHYCLGQGLARLEARIAFEKLFARFPGIAAAGRPVRNDRLVLRGYRTLPVRLG
jgi:cytochrome P450